VLRRFKLVLVESFVGAIALGWLFAQGILHFAYIFAVPVVNWVGRNTYRKFADQAGVPLAFSLRDSLPELARSVSLLVVGYVLLRWLYFKPIEQYIQRATPSAGQPD